MFKAVIRRAAASLGYDIVASGCGSRLALNDALRSIFASGIDLVVDVGAHRGEYRDLLRDQIGYRGMILSFEPNPDLAEYLAKRASRDGNWIIDARAAGKDVGNLPLNITASSDLSSLRKPVDGPTAWNNAQVSRRVNVEVTTLTTLENTVGLRFNQRRKLLKVDTQGHDLDVIRGANLWRYVAIQMELSQIALYENQPPINEVIAELREQGFLLAAASPVALHEGVAVEFDCLFVHSTRPCLAAR